MAKICFLGDVFAEKSDTMKAWTGALRADCCFFNFEYVYDDGTLLYADAAEGKINLKGNGNPFIPTFPMYAVSLANNHIMDYTDNGCEATVRFLKSCQVPYVGIEREGAESQRFVRLPGDVTVSVYLQKHLVTSMPADSKWRVNVLEEDTVLADARAAHAVGSRYHVVYLHWGTELFPKPWPNQQALAHRLIDSGLVQIVIGAHAHCIQSYECYNGHWIFYGLGNAIFPNYRNLPGDFHKGIPGRDVSEYWGASGTRSLCVIVDSESGDVDAYVLRYDKGSGTLQTLGRARSGNVGGGVTLGDCYLAAFRRWTIGFRAMVHGNFMLTAWHLKIGWRSFRSYFRTYRKIRKGNEE